MLTTKVTTCIIYEVTFLIESVNFEAPDFAIFLTCIVTVDAVDVTIVVDDGLEITQRSIGCQTETVFELAPTSFVTDFLSPVGAFR